MSATKQTHFASKLIRVGRRMELEYYEFGAEDRDAHPLLFHYGLPGSGYLASLAHETAKQLGVRIIAPNRPGTGRSTFDPNRKLADWPDAVARLADALRVDRATVLGVSSGGAYACALGHLRPDRVASIVLFSSLSPLENPGVIRSMRLLNRVFCLVGRRFPTLTLIPSQVLAVRYYQDPSGLMEQLTSGLADADRAIMNHPEVAAAFDTAMEETFRQGAHGLAHDINLVTGPWVDLTKVTCPVRIFHGDQDGIAPLAMAHYLRDRFPRATLEIVPGGGHMIAVDVMGTVGERFRRILLADAAGQASAFVAPTSSVAEVAPERKGDGTGSGTFIDLGDPHNSVLSPPPRTP